MNRRLNSVSVESAGIRLESGSLRIDFNSNTPRKKTRFWRVLSLLVFFGKLIKAFNAKSLRATSLLSSQEKENLMSATAPVSESNGTKTSKREMLDALVKQNKTVEVSTDNTLDCAREMEPNEFREVFEKKVNGVSGFKAPMPRQSSK